MNTDYQCGSRGSGLRERISPVRSRLATLAIIVGLVGCGGDGDNGGSLTDPDGLQPSLSTVSPDSGNVGTRVEITGSQLEAGATVSFDGLAADSVEFVDSSTLLAFAPGGLVVGELYDVEVTNPGGKSASVVDAYKAVDPALLVVNGVSRPSGNAGSTVILEGKSFGDLLALGSVYFTDDTGQPLQATVSLPENWTDEFVVATVPSGTAEEGPLWIETPNGATDSVTFRVLAAASFSPSLINWTATTSLPAPVQGLGSGFLALETGPASGQLVFVTGGADGTVAPDASVHYSEIGAAGEFGAWTPATALPAVRAFHGMAVATPFSARVDTLDGGHLYVVGGIDASGAPTNTVYHSTVGLDRGTSAWASETPLPQPLHSMGAVVFRSWLYIVGGATTGDDPVATVYRANIGEDGSLGTWETQPSLPTALAYPAVQQAAGVIYVLGGEAAAVVPGDASVTATSSLEVLYNRLDLRTAELTGSSWSVNPNDLIKAQSKHSAVAAGGWLLVSGGLYNGASTSSTEHAYSSINPDASLGSFNGATGSQTIVSAGGVPFYNHDAVAYVDAAGEAHVVILGGANVSDAGTTLDGVWIY